MWVNPENFKDGGRRLVTEVQLLGQLPFPSKYITLPPQAYMVVFHDEASPIMSGFEPIDFFSLPLALPNSMHISHSLAKSYGSSIKVFYTYMHHDAEIRKIVWAFEIHHRPWTIYAHFLALGCFEEFGG